MKISIIVPIYNLGEFYINRCVSSILAQTYKDFELILVDDGSTDSSKDICDLMLLKDKRIRVLHKENGGAASARIYGVEHSKGVWITFVDGDDVIESNMYERLLNNAIKYHADISHCGIKYCFYDGRVKMHWGTGDIKVFDRDTGIYR